MADRSKDPEFLKFVEYYKSIPLEERYPLGKVFYQETGGKLSPHNNPLTVAVAIVRIQDDDGSVKLLGLKRGIPPFVGGVAFAGGYTEYLESGHMAAARELREELGIDLRGEDFEVFGNALMSPTNNDLLFFLHKDVFPKALLDSVVLSRESLSVELIDAGTEMCFPHHKAKSLAALALPIASTAAKPKPGA